MTEQQPLVSIVIPCYNHAQFVQETIQSVIDQDYENIELIIIDDGSNDNSVEVIQEMIPACEERFVRFEFRCRPNKGLSATLNEGMAWSQGSYLGFCSSDDMYHPSKVNSQIKYFLTHKEINYCYTGAFIQDDNNNILVKQTEEINKPLTDNITFEDIFTFKQHFPVTGMYKTRFIIEDLKGFDENLSAEDYDINLRIISLTKIGYIPQKLYYYRSPAAIGGARKRLPMRVDVSESHLNTIRKYKDNPAYRAALLEWNLRRFIYFSSYTETKIYALKGMFFSVPKVTNINYIKSLIKLVFIWK